MKQSRCSPGHMAIASTAMLILLSIAVDASACSSSSPSRASGGSCCARQASAQCKCCTQPSGGRVSVIAIHRVLVTDIPRVSPESGTFQTFQCECRDGEPASPGSKSRPASSPHRIARVSAAESSLGPDFDRDAAAVRLISEFDTPPGPHFCLATTHLRF